MFTLNCPGEGNGQFQGPTGLTVDSQDNIIVAGDCSNNSAKSDFNFKVPN